MFNLYDVKDSMEDLDEIMDLIYAEWGNSFSSSKESKLNKIKEAISNNVYLPKIYALKKDNVLIGTFTIKDKDLDNCDLSPWIACVVVKKEYRGKGYANALLKYIKEIIDNNYKEMYLVTDLNNFYEKIGFEFIKLVDHNNKKERLYKYNG